VVRDGDPLARRVEREREAHTADDVLAANIKLKKRFPHLEDYPSKKRLLDAMDAYTQDLGGRSILDYGCGRGEKTLRYLANGADFVAAIDISTAYIDDLNSQITASGYRSRPHDVRVMDAHSLDFPAGTFDLVVGYGILHHLDVPVAMGEIHRVLKPNGRVVLQEPLADDPLLRVFRRLTPSARTVDERPLTRSDLEGFEQDAQWSCEMLYCGILEMPLAVATSILLPRRYADRVLAMADRLERSLERVRVLRSWNQYVAINLVKTPS